MAFCILCGYVTSKIAVALTYSNGESRNDADSCVALTALPSSAVLVGAVRRPVPPPPFA